MYEPDEEKEGNEPSFNERIKTFLKSRLRVSSTPITCKPFNGSPLNGIFSERTSILKSLRNAFSFSFIMASGDLVCASLVPENVASP